MKQLNQLRNQRELRNQKRRRRRRRDRQIRYSHRGSSSSVYNAYKYVDCIARKDLRLIQLCIEPYDIIEMATEHADNPNIVMKERVNF